MNPDHLILQLEGPLMSFGGVMVDNLGRTRRFPGCSMLVGLLANAMGWHHRDSEKLQRLQDRLRFASRIDRPGAVLRDYQTVDLGQDEFQGTGWTTRGQVEERGGGEASDGTHIRYREFLADGRVVVALRLEPVDDDPDLTVLESALFSPARPLFLGRKCCLPSVPIMVRRVRAVSTVEALASVPASRPGPFEIEWPLEETGPEKHRIESVSDRRDWLNQTHGGERWVRIGQLEVGTVRGQ